MPRNADHSRDLCCLGYRELRVLLAVGSAPRQRRMRYAELASCNPKHVNSYLKRLREKGFITYRAYQHDFRVTDIGEAVYRASLYYIQLRSAPPLPRGTMNSMEAPTLPAE